MTISGDNFLCCPMPNLPIYIFDLGGVLIRLDVGRCMRAFEALMGEENMRNHLLDHPQQHRRTVKTKGYKESTESRTRVRRALERSNDPESGYENGNVVWGKSWDLEQLHAGVIA